MENSECSVTRSASDDALDGMINDYDPENLVERTFDPDDETATETVVCAIADAADVAPLDLAPLYDSVDPDALDALFRQADRETAVTFVHAGHYVTVSGAGRVVVAQKETN